MSIFNNLRLQNRHYKKIKGPVKQRFFELRNFTFHGGVYAPDTPDYRFHVGLLDEQGQVLFSTRADKKSLRTGEIPDGHGFSLPIPYDWLSMADAPPFFQFKILETNEVFPKAARILPVNKLLKKQGESAKTEIISPLPGHICHLTQVIRELAGDKILAVGTHAMDRTGAPMIILEILKQLNQRHGYTIILLCLGPRGSLFPEFDQYCEIVVENLEEASKIAKKEYSELFATLATSCQPKTALINSLCSTKLVESCAQAGLQVYSLIHEYPYAFEPDWVQRHLKASSRVAFPCEDVYQTYHNEGFIDLADTAEVDSEGDGETSQFSILPQGCYQLEKKALSKEAIETFTQEFRKENHLSEDDTLVVSCGTIDSRKGFDWFISLIRHYLRQSANAANTHFLWIGKVNEWEVFHHGLHDLRLEGIIGHLHHLDEVDDVRLPMLQADIFLLCSRVDPFPSVVLEAFLAGVPVIGFNKGQGSLDMIRETGFGTVVDYLNIDDTIRAIDDLSHGSWKQKRVKQYGKTFVEDRFQYSAYVNALANLIDGKSAPSSPNQANTFYLPKQPGTLPPVMLMGFHRSGTSWMADTLHSMGIDMKPSGEFLAGGKGNPHGHFEDLFILDHHCEMMQSQYADFMQQWGGKRCIFLPDYNNSWRDHQGEAAALSHHLAKTTPWGWKDPRSLLFFDLWNSTPLKPVKILVIRHPLEIYASLLRRNTDPYFSANPLSFFEAYEAYHQSALIDFEQHPDEWFIISMPSDVMRLVALRDFLSSKLNTEFPLFTELENFDSTSFHQLNLSQSILDQFNRLFPLTSYIYRTFSGQSLTKPINVNPELENQLQWLSDTLPNLLKKTPPLTNHDDLVTERK